MSQIISLSAHLSPSWTRGQFRDRGPQRTESEDLQHFEIQDFWKATEAKGAGQVDVHWRPLELCTPQQWSLRFLYFLFLRLLVTRIHLHKPTFLHFQHSVEARLSPKCRLNWTVTHKTNIHKRPFCNFFNMQRKLTRDFGDRFSTEKLDQFSDSYYLSLHLKEAN